MTIPGGARFRAAAPKCPKELLVDDRDAGTTGLDVIAAGRIPVAAGRVER
jgi:hypothetical protein